VQLLCHADFSIQLLFRTLQTLAIIMGNTTPILVTLL
jgi:hypothetical protein